MLIRQIRLESALSLAPEEKATVDATEGANITTRDTIVGQS